MLGLLNLYMCENCEMKVILPNGKIDDIFLKENLFLENMKRLCDLYFHIASMPETEYILFQSLTQILEDYLKSSVYFTPKIDNLVLLLCSGTSDKEKNMINSFLFKYRHIANPDLLYVQINLILSNKNFEITDNLFSTNDVYLCGFSDHILKFLAERGGKKQLTYVENIDKKYNLEEVIGKKGLIQISNSDDTRVNEISPYFVMPKWKTVRIFVSSTFKDMHAERDLLVRFVFPELRARASSMFIKINEVDLRWGITEEVSASKRCAELCLREAASCDLFIGILGERYGTIYDFEPPDDPAFDWIKSYPSGSSITELEMQAGALNDPLTSKSRAFFYFRNSDFLRKVPKTWLSWFTSENSESKERLITLKKHILSSGLKVLDGYSCNYAGVYKGNPVVAGLETFGQTVLDDLWASLCNSYKKEKHLNEMEEEWDIQWSQLDEHKYFFGKDKTPMASCLSEIKIQKQGIFIVTGKPGCGKTAFIVQLIKEFKEDFIIPFFIGSSPRSSELFYMLEYIVYFIHKRLSASTFLYKSKADILNHFTDILAEGANGSVSGTLIIIIDGLDHLDTSSQNLDWMPHNLPAGVKLICTASENSLPYAKFQAYKRYGYPVYFTVITPLQISDRQELVRTYLQQHRKALDESSFNNQMLQLVTKLDGGNPCFLRLACNFLRLFATFENLMSTLQNFPSILRHAFNEIITVLEKEYNSDIVQRVFTVICITKEGISENELCAVLNASMEYNTTHLSLPFNEILTAVSNSQHKTLLSSIDLRSLLHILYSFTCRFPRDGFLKMYSSEFLNAVKDYYLNKGYEQWTTIFHRFLAAHFIIICDPNNNGTWKGQSASAFRSLLFHLFYGQCYKKLSTVLCSLHFLRAVYKVHASEDILEFFTSLLKREPNKSDNYFQQEKFDCIMVQDFYKFVSQNAYIFQSSPNLVFQQAVNQPIGSSVYKAVMDKSSTIECLSKQNILDFQSFTVDFIKSISCVMCHKTEPIAFIGSEDGYLKLLDIDTGKVLMMQKGHSSFITSICYVAKNFICTASSDSTLSIWNITDFIQTAVLKGHERYVSDCCSDPSGTVILSSSWDSTVRLWSRDGSIISTLSNFRSPINCIAHHPELQEVACGLWNKNVEIWDTVSLKRKYILHGHSGSVRALSYSTKGMLLSSSVFMEVFIWSPAKGLQLGYLKGHFLPLNDITYSIEKNFFITASDDCTLKVWPELQDSSIIRINESKFCPILFMEIVKPDYLGVAFQNSEIRIYNILNGHNVSTLNCSSDPVSCFGKYSEDIFAKKYFISNICDNVLFGTAHGKIMALNIENSTTTCFSCLGSAITSLVYNINFFIGGDSDGDIGLFVFEKKEENFADVVAHSSSVTALTVFVSDGNIMALSASTDMALKLWKVSIKKSIKLSLLKDFGKIHKDYVTACCLTTGSFFSESEEEIFIAGSYDGCVSLRLRENNEAKTFCGLETSVISVFVIASSIIGCSADGSIAVWNKDGKMLSKIDAITQSSLTVRFSLHSDCGSNELNIIRACVNNDGSIDVQKPFQRFRQCSLEGHSKPVISCSANEWGCIVSCAADKKVIIWNIPELHDDFTQPSGCIMSIAFSKTENLIISGDNQGSLVVFSYKTDCDEPPLKYITHKKYAGCSVNIVWYEESVCVCATSQVVKGKWSYYLNILDCKQELSDCETSFIITERCHRCVSNEIISIDFMQTDDIFIVGLKSGEILLLGTDLQIQVEVAKDWILKCTLSGSIIPVLCITEATGIAKQFSVTSLLHSKEKKLEKINDLTLKENDNLPFWTTAISNDDSGVFYCGSLKGQLQIFSNRIMNTKQVHYDKVTGVCICENYLFTSSLDKSVRVWHVSTLKQVGEFRCSVPISCLAVRKSDVNSATYLLTIGTTQGATHLLKWIPQK